MRKPLLLLLLLMHTGCGQAQPQGGGPHSATPSTSPIAWTPEPALVTNLKAHVTMLAHTIGQRNTDHPESYQKAERYLESTLQKLGYKVERQAYKAGGQNCINLWTERPGSEETLVIGAHYDTCDVTPGADDNASGCAALLELARMLKNSKEGPTVRFVLFANEEPPYFQTDAMGSLVYAQSCQKAGETFLGMISLESIGFFSDAPGSQKFPVGISGYPDTGNFVGFVSDLSSKPFMQRCLSAFQSAKTLHAEGLAAPGVVSGVMWSDHWSFSKCGYPSLMITDTAPFRNPHYHMSTDTIDTLDYERLAAVTEGTRQMVLNLSPEAP